MSSAQQVWFASVPEVVRNTGSEALCAFLRLLLSSLQTGVRQVQVPGTQ